MRNEKEKKRGKSTEKIQNRKSGTGNMTKENNKTLYWSTVNNFILLNDITVLLEIFKSSFFYMLNINDKNTFNLNTTTTTTTTSL